MLPRCLLDTLLHFSYAGKLTVILPTLMKNSEDIQHTFQSCHTKFSRPLNFRSRKFMSSYVVYEKGHGKKLINQHSPYEVQVVYALLRPLAQCSKVGKILKGNLDLTSSPSHENLNYGRKVYLRCKGKTLLGVINKVC